MLLLCVQWTGERFRVEINVKFKDPEVYIWGERGQVGDAPALGNQTGSNRQVCMHASRWARCELEWNSEASSIWP